LNNLARPGALFYNRFSSTLEVVPYDSKAVANYFLKLAERDGKELDPMKLQKLVYFAHGWYLAVNDQPLIDDIIEAWRYGPVIPTLYHEFKAFGRGAITRGASTMVASGTKIRFCIPELAPSSDTDFLNRIWETYGVMTAVQLSNMTHAPGTPWESVWNKNEGRKNVNIPDDLIKQYFVAQLNATE
jgi:uncharacterized phage-associated protein